MINDKNLRFEVWTLTLLFIGLKLSGHIAWSWWWVLSPTWITCLVAVALVAVGLVVMLVEKAGKK